MEKIEMLLDLMEYVTKSRKRKHFVGGLLLSAAFFFAGIAVTTMTISLEDNEQDQEEIEQDE